MKLCNERKDFLRLFQKNLTYVGTRAMLVFSLPLAEVVFDFYDKQIKSITSGYASFDYEFEKNVDKMTWLKYRF